VTAESSSSFDRLFEESSEPAFILDPHRDRILAANLAGLAMLGYTHEELLATPISDIHPAELPQLMEFLEGVLRDGHGSTIKLTCRTKDGTFLPSEMSLQAVRSGDRVYILGLVADRSQHRQRTPGA
jgi:PAS domain S-box-containing protein